jgi:hypothetical protein
MGAFITLEVCEQIIDRPAALTTQDVAVDEIGEVLCAREPRRCDEEEAVRALLALLGDLLVCSAPGVPAMLLELVERGPTEGVFTLDRLRDDLEACLLPLNRGATRRVLARLLREARKTTASARPSLQPSAAELDADFDALLGGGGPRAQEARRRSSAPTQGPAPSFERAPAQTSASARTQLDEQAPARSQLEQQAPVRRRRNITPVTVPLPQAMFSQTAPPLTAAVTQSPLTAAINKRFDPRQPLPSMVTKELEPERSVPLVAEASPALADELEPEVADHVDDDESEREPTRERPLKLATRDLDTADLVEIGEKPSRAGLYVFVGCLVAALGLIGAYVGLGREGVRSALGLLPQPRVADAAVRSPFVPGAAKQRSVGELRVSSNVGRAQVFLLIGPGPAIATDLPVGVAQEFVAIAEGYAPARAVVPADAAWEEVDGKPRYEIAIQATRSNQDASKLGLGPTLLPRDVGTPQAKLGSVRIVTTPKGAKVYQLIGFTPDVRVENLPLDEDYDVMVYVEGRPPVARHVEAADFENSDGKRVCEIDVTLTPAKAR